MDIFNCARLMKGSYVEECPYRDVVLCCAGKGKDGRYPNGGGAPQSGCLQVCFQEVKKTWCSAGSLFYLDCFLRWA